MFLYFLFLYFFLSFSTPTHQYPTNNNASITPIGELFLRLHGLSLFFSNFCVMLMITAKLFFLCSSSPSLHWPTFCLQNIYRIFSIKSATHFPCCAQTFNRLNSTSGFGRFYIIFSGLPTSFCLVYLG